MSVITEEKIWDAFVLSVAHHNPHGLGIKQIKMNTLVEPLFNGDTELFHRCLSDVVYHLHVHENIEDFEISVPKHYLFNSFRTCRSVFFYFYLKINGIEKNAVELYRTIGSFEPPKKGQ